MLISFEEIVLFKMYKWYIMDKVCKNEIIIVKECNGVVEKNYFDKCLSYLLLFCRSKMFFIIKLWLILIKEIFCIIIICNFWSILF